MREMNFEEAAMEARFVSYEDRFDDSYASDDFGDEPDGDIPEDDGEEPNPDYTAGRITEAMWAYVLKRSAR